MKEYHSISNLDILKGKIESIDRAERDYKKYSIYLQAVHRDGIPSHIIRKKIPIINSKINSIVGKIANFKVPKRLIVVPELPRNAMGKVQKNILRQTYS